MRRWHRAFIDGISKTSLTENNWSIRVKKYAVSCGRKADSCKRVCGFVWTEGWYRVRRYAVSKISGLVRTGLIDYILYETRVQETLNNQTCVKRYVVSCWTGGWFVQKKVCGFMWTEGWYRVKRYAVSSGRKVDSCKKVCGLKNIRIRVDGTL